MAKVTGTFRAKSSFPQIKVMKKIDFAGKTSAAGKKVTAKQVCGTVLNVANVAMVAADFGKVVYRYANGNINKAECVEQLGKKGACYVSSIAASKTGAIVGGALGSAVGSVVPGVGTAVGLTVGAVAGEIMGDVVGYKAGDEIGKVVTKTVKDKTQQKNT